MGSDAARRSRRLGRGVLAAIVGAGGIAVTTVAPSPAEATPLACTDTCEIEANIFTYVLPATEVASGAKVQWRSTDTAHPTGEALAGTPCFGVPVSVNGTPVPVQFDIAGDALTATVDGRTRTCTSALSIAGAAQVLSYQCRLHPNMVGALVVTTA